MATTTCYASGNGRRVELTDAWQFIGYAVNDPVRRLLLRQNGSHIEIHISGDEPLIAVLWDLVSNKLYANSQDHHRQQVQDRQNNTAQNCPAESGDAHTGRQHRNQLQH